jgi:A/G-specific adenine glycosylase
VVAEHGGAFPDTHAGLSGLKGVGAYTAAAISSIAFDRPEAVVDGNVYRVLARVFGIDLPTDSSAGRKVFQDLADSLLDPAHPGDHNQAVMELGATVCAPRNPACDRCPLATKCVARKEDRINMLPVKAGRTVVRDRYFHYLIIPRGKGLLLHQRTGKDIWRDLYQPPLIETTGPGDRRSVGKAADQLLGGPITLGERSAPVRHVLSHQVIHARFWQAEPPARRSLPDGWVVVKESDLARYAVPRLIERYLQAHFAQDLFS